MKIRVDVEVPDGEYCDIKGDKCKHYKYNRQSHKYKCQIFNRPLVMDDWFNLIKCRKCLNATRVEVEE